MAEGWFYRVVEPGDAYCLHRFEMCDISYPGDENYPPDDVSDDLRGGTRRAAVVSCVCGGIWRVPICGGTTRKGVLCRVRTFDSAVQRCKAHEGQEAVDVVIDPAVAERGARLGGNRCNAVKSGTDDRCKMPKLESSNQWCYYHDKSKHATVHPSVTEV